jgi:hypothetical protein
MTIEELEARIALLEEIVRHATVGNEWPTDISWKHGEPPKRKELE